MAKVVPIFVQFFIGRETTRDRIDLILGSNLAPLQFFFGFSRGTVLIIGHLGHSVCTYLPGKVVVGRLPKMVSTTCACGQPNAKLLCSKCKQQHYCGRECQVAHFKVKVFF